MKKRFNVTIDEKLIKQIDEAAEKLGQSRSGFLSMTAATYIQQSNIAQSLPTLLMEIQKFDKKQAAK